MRAQRVVLATGNPGKLRQFSELLGAAGLELVRQSDFGIEPPPETGSTFLENSLLKARNAARLTGLPAIADDSGIEVDALDGRPGLYSARYAGEGASDDQNLRKMLLELENVPAANRAARYRSIIVFLATPTIPRRWSARVSGKAPSPRLRAAPAVSATTLFSFRAATHAPRRKCRWKNAMSAAIAARPRVPFSRSSTPGYADENATARVVRALPLVRAEVPVLRFQFVHLAR